MSVPCLPASAYRPGDSVVGEDEGVRLFGAVSKHHRPEERHRGDDVLVYWSGEEYETTSLGHVVPAELLRLWPEPAHAARVAEVVGQPPSTFPQGEAFHAHLDACARCRNQPFNLCPDGSRLLAAAGAP